MESGLKVIFKFMSVVKEDEVVIGFWFWVDDEEINL